MHKYKKLHLPGHHRATPQGNVFEHVVIAERALGKPLLRQYPVHHVDFDSQNNANNNLVICESVAYHLLLHVRTRALIACGNPCWRKCELCKLHDAPENLYINKSGKTRVVHGRCSWKLGKASRAKRNAAKAAITATLRINQ